MATKEELIQELSDAVISCKKDAVLAAVEKAKKVMIQNSGDNCKLELKRNRFEFWDYLYEFIPKLEICFLSLVF